MTPPTRTLWPLGPLLALTLVAGCERSDDEAEPLRSELARLRTRAARAGVDLEGGPRRR